MRRAAAAAVVGFLPFAACPEDGDAPTGPDPDPPTSALIERVEVVSEASGSGTYLAGEELVFSALLTSGAAVEASGEVFLLFDLGLASQPAVLAARETGRLEFRYQVRRGDYDGDGISVPAGELRFGPGAALRVGGADLDANVPEVPADGGHRVFARFSPGESLVFDAALDRFPVDSLGLEGAVGCRASEDLTPLLQAVLEGNLPAAEVLFRIAWPPRFGTTGARSTTSCSPTDRAASRAGPRPPRTGGPSPTSWRNRRRSVQPARARRPLHGASCGSPPPSASRSRARITRSRPTPCRAQYMGPPRCFGNP